MSYYNRDDDEREGEEEEEDDEKAFKLQMDNIIVVIDARPNMHKQAPPPDQNNTYFELSLKATLQLLKNKVIVSPTHKVGVGFLGVMGGEEVGYQTILPLEPPTAKGIRKLKNLVEGLECRITDFDEVYTPLPEGSPCPLREALVAASQQFTKAVKAGAVPAIKKFVLYTNDDDPFGAPGQEELAERAIQVARDQEQKDINFSLTDLPRPDGKRFNIQKFFGKIMQVDEDDTENYAQGRSASDWGGYKELVERVTKKETRARLGRTTLQIGDGIQIGVQLLNFIQPSKVPNQVTVHKRSLKDVITVTEYVDVEVTGTVEEHNIKTYMEFGGVKAYITKDEVASMKQHGSPGILVLGFKDRTVIREDHILKSPFFLYPDEEKVKGSSTAFAAILQSMLNRAVVCVAKYVRNEGAAPRFVYLVPQGEEKDESGRQTVPPGLHLMPMPFADEVREVRRAHQVDLDDSDEEGEGMEHKGGEGMGQGASEEAVTAARQMISAIALDGFDCHDFSNPALQKHYAALQSIALGERSVDWDSKKSDTIRAPPGLAEVAAPGASALQTLCGGDDIVEDKKRKRADGDGEKKAKVKVELSERDWRADLKSGAITSYTIPDLKCILKELSQPVSGKKADLLQRIEDAAA